jgi:hypothetical protein
MTVMEQHETNKSSSYSLADSPVPVFGLPCLSYLDHALCGLLGVITSILYYHIRTYPAVNFCEWTWFSGCVWVMLASLGLRHCSYPWQFKTSSSFAISGEIIRHISSDGSSGLNRCTGSSPRQYKEVNCICVPEWAGGNQPGLRSRQSPGEAAACATPQPRRAIASSPPSDGSPVGGCRLLSGSRPRIPNGFALLALGRLRAGRRATSIIPGLLR